MLRDKAIRRPLVLRIQKQKKKIAAVLSSFVALGTVSALTMPAITLNEPVCGIDEHKHVLTCYAEGAEEGLLCNEEILELHAHDGSCYDENLERICGKVDFVIHEHNDYCMDESGQLVCELPEIEEYKHDESCYTEAKSDLGHSHVDTCYEWIKGEKPVCGQEAAEAHSHSENCYTVETVAVCGLEESEGHSHSADCHGEDGGLVCTQEEAEGHAHEETCYQESKTLICEEQEQNEEVHQHSDECYELVKGELICTEQEREPSEASVPGELVCICGKEEAIAHSHEDECYGLNEAGEKVLVCKTTEVLEHNHGKDCIKVVSGDLLCEIEEHIHGDKCLESVPLSKEEQDQVNDLILMISNLPPVDEVKAEIEKLEADESNEELLAYKEKIITAVNAATEIYNSMTESQKAAVTNAAVLQEYSFLMPVDERPALTGDSFLMEGDGFNISVTLADSGMPEGTGITLEPMMGDMAAFTEAEGEADLSDPYNANMQKVLDFLKEGESSLFDVLMMDIHLTNSDGTELPYEGEAEVTIDFAEPLLQGDGHIYMLHLTESGAVDVTESFERDENGVSQITIRTRGFSPYALTRAAAMQTVNIYGVNSYVGNVSPNTNPLICYSGTTSKTVKSIMGTGMSYKFWSAYTISYQNGQYVVTAVNSAAVSKLETNVPANGCVVLINDINNIVAGVGDIATFSSNFWQSNKTYNATSKGTVSFSTSGSEKPTKDNTAKLNVIDAASTRSFVELNLYDYGNNINDPYKDSKFILPGFQQEYGSAFSTYNNYSMGNFNYGNNVTKDLLAGINGVTTQLNRGPINYTTNGANSPISGAMKSTLGNDGYPALASGESLKYLFSDNEYADKLNTQSIDGLFQYDPVTRSYSYNCRENHAQFNSANDTFTLYKEMITPNHMMYPFGNFMPLNDIVHDSQQSSLVTRAYLKNIAESANYKYSQGEGGAYEGGDNEYLVLSNRLNSFIALMDSKQGTTGWAPEATTNAYFGVVDIPARLTNADLESMYTIDYDEPSNFFFGMDMKMTFRQPRDGRIYYTVPNAAGGNDQNSYPMYFYFTGDDDVWVYIDDQLTLDLSGIHRHVGGAIDFEKGLVIYAGFDKAVGDVSADLEFAERVVTFEELFGWETKYADEMAKWDELTEAEKEALPFTKNGERTLYKQHFASEATGIHTEGWTFSEYSPHTFNFYYMERGAGSSVCRINFNFPVIQDNAISITKELSTDAQETIDLLGNPDFKFQLWNEDATALFVKAGETYEVYDQSNKLLRTETVNNDGIITIKAGETAVLKVPEDKDRYFVRELLDTDAFELYGNISVDGHVATQNDSEIQGFVGLDSPVRDIADSSSTVFTFDNKITTNKLGSLTIEKKLELYPIALDTQSFSFEVSLSDKKLPVDTEYLIYNVDTDGNEVGEPVTATVTEEGIITIQAGQRAKIPNIISGTAFEVKESEVSAAGYTVSYSVDGTATNTDNASGIIKTNVSTAVTVTNSENGADISLSLKKTLQNTDALEHSFNFKLEQVTDSTGNSLVNGFEALTKTLTFTAGENTSVKEDFFKLVYLEREMTDLPQTYYYKISEVNEGQAGVTYDTAVYVAEVTVSKGTDNKLTAQLTGFWKNGEAVTLTDTVPTAEFVNSLHGDLTLKKVLSGITNSDKEFDFTVTVKQGETPVSGTFNTEKIVYGVVNDTVTAGTITLDENGKTSVKLKAGEGLKIKNLPVGASWTVAELNTEGYTVTYDINGNAVIVGAEANGSVAIAPTTVTCTNHSGYELPQTGGTGTQIYYITGGLLLIGTALLLFYRKTRGSWVA